MQSAESTEWHERGTLRLAALPPAYISMKIIIVYAQIGPEPYVLPCARGAKRPLIVYTYIRVSVEQSDDRSRPMHG